MTLERLRPGAEAVMRPAVRLSLAVGATPHSLSVVGFLWAVAAAVGFYLGPSDWWWYALATVFVALNGAFDLLDGAVARELTVSSSAGDVLDHTLDRYADIVLVFGLAAGAESYLLGFLAITGVVMTSYLGTQAQAVDFGRLYAGVLGRSDRLVLIGLIGVVMAVHPEAVYGLVAVDWLLVLFAVVGHLTAVQRFVVLWRGLS